MDKKSIVNDLYQAAVISVLAVIQCEAKCEAKCEVIQCEVIQCEAKRY